MSGKKIAVTGANGFVGSHIVIALLEGGYDVVGVVRDPSNIDKTKFLQDEADKLKGNETSSGNLSFKSGDLFISGSYDDAFKDCFGVVHTAAIVQLGHVDNAEEKVVKPAVQGTMNVLSSIKKNSNTIKRFLNISSVAAIISVDKPIGHVFTEDDWNTWSTIERGDAYGYAKTKAEKTVWDDEELRSKIDVIVSFNPSVVLGPVYTKDHATKSSAAWIYSVMTGRTLFETNITFVDVRDICKGVLCAFTKDKVTVDGKRFILNATDPMPCRTALNDYVKKSHPEIPGAKLYMNATIASVAIWLGRNVSFLSKPLQYNEFYDKFLQQRGSYDNTRSKDVLGIGSYRSMDDTCRDTAESMKPFIDSK